MMLAWKPLLTAWDAAAKAVVTEPDRIWKVVDEICRFLAPRFVAVQQWQNGAAAADRTDRAKTEVVW